MSRSPFAVAGLAIGCALALAGAPGAQGRPGGGARTPTGYDISYPQCGRPFPANVLFGIVGVNDGIVYSPNPCLGTGDGASELAWALQSGPPAFYANTADPGPALSTHWPSGQSTPQQCDTLLNPGPDSSQCSYDYGWNAAADSYRDAVSAYAQLGVAAGPASSAWWLDVETANSWEPDVANNVSALQGEVDYLASQGVASVGLYVSPADWAAITGGTGAFAALPYWRPGAGDQAAAQSYCGSAGPTGHAVTLSQYSSGRYDADVRC